MPATTTTKYTEHGDIACLWITSNDPRRLGRNDCAIFDIDALGYIKRFKWRMRWGEVVSEDNVAFAKIISKYYGDAGSHRHELNEDYRRANFYKPRPDPAITEKMRAALKASGYKSQSIYFRQGNFAKKKYKSLSDWCEVEVEIQHKAKVKIKVNNFLLHHVPKRLMWIDTKGLYYPIEAEDGKVKRNAYGKVVCKSLLKRLGDIYKIDYGGRGGFPGKLMDMYDYRINAATGKFLAVYQIKNVYHKCQLGDDHAYILDIIYPHGLDKRIPTSSDDEGSHYYMLIPEDMYDVVRVQHWYMHDHDSPSAYMDLEGSPLDGKNVQLKRYLAELYGHQVNKITIGSRYTKLYERALEKISTLDPKSAAYKRAMRSRIRFESTPQGEKTTSNRMYVEAKVLSFRRIFVHKFVDVQINGKVVTVTDHRRDAIRVGGKL